MSEIVSVADFKKTFDRDFSFGTQKTNVRDQDIARAIAESNVSFNPGLWSDTVDKAVAFGYLVAHNLAKLIQAGGGLTGGGGVNSSGKSPIQSKSIGVMNISYALPEDITNSPFLSQYMTTGYGMKYLALLAPLMVGGMDVVNGETQP